jgi:hypothetical protein
MTGCKFKEPSVDVRLYCPKCKDFVRLADQVYVDQVLSMPLSRQLELYEIEGDIFYDRFLCESCRGDFYGISPIGKTKDSL